MIVVTGTKRSGTSMWMQILQASGIKIVGRPFSKRWEETIKSANKRGFHESPLRRGIYYATNPHPETGRWLPPKESRHLGVKVFVPGTLRSDVVYLSRVIASVRPFRQYSASLRRLYAMEEEHREKRGKGGSGMPHLDATLEWWLENFLLIRDAATRGYPVRLVAYESVLQNPRGVLSEIFRWLQVGDFEAACEAVHPEDRTQHALELPEEDHPYAAVFDELYRRVLHGEPFDEDFIVSLNKTHEALLPEITQALQGLGEAQRKRRRRKPLNLLAVDSLDRLLHPDESSEL